MARDAALAEARQEGLPEHLLDTLSRPPGRSGTTVVGGVAVRTVAEPSSTTPDTPTNTLLRTLPFSAELSRPAMTVEEAIAVCEHASRQLGFPFVLDWGSGSTRIEVDAKRATHVVVPGGVVRAPGMTPDALALILAHERGHRVLETKNEARADHWAARYGARMLWPELAHDALLDLQGRLSRARHAACDRRAPRFLPIAIAGEYVAPLAGSIDLRHIQGCRLECWSECLTQSRRLGCHALHVARELRAPPTSESF